MVKNLRRRQFFLFFIYLQFLFGWAALSCGPYTYLKGTRYPTYQGPPLKKIMVQARSPGIKQAMDIELAFSRTLSSPLLTVVPASSFSPPLPPTIYDARPVLEGHGIDGVLVVSLLGSQKKELYHPGTPTRKVVKHKDGTTTVIKRPGQGYTEHKMIQEHEIVLMDLEGRPVWIGEAETKGDYTYLDDLDFARQVAKDTKKQMEKANLIGRPPSP